MSKHGDAIVMQAIELSALKREVRRLRRTVRGLRAHRDELLVKMHGRHETIGRPLDAE